MRRGVEYRKLVRKHNLLLLASKICVDRRALINALLPCLHSTHGVVFDEQCAYADFE